MVSLRAIAHLRDFVGASHLHAVGKVALGDLMQHLDGGIQRSENSLGDDDAERQDQLPPSPTPRQSK